MRCQGAARAPDSTMRQKWMIWPGKRTTPARHIQGASAHETAAGPQVQMRTSVPNCHHSRVECVSRRSSSVSLMST